MVSTDGTVSIWIVGLLCLALGLVLGCMATYLAISRNDRNYRLQNELNQLRERFSDYRDQVTLHFMRTSELVQEMTHSYRAVYEHLACGAQDLCTERADIGQLDTPKKTSLADNTEALAAELSNIEDDIEALLGETPRISDLDISSASEKHPVQH